MYKLNNNIQVEEFDSSYFIINNNIEKKEIFEIGSITYFIIKNLEKFSIDDLTLYLKKYYSNIQKEIIQKKIKEEINLLLSKKVLIED